MPRTRGEPGRATPTSRRAQTRRETRGGSSGSGRSEGVQHATEHATERQGPSQEQSANRVAPTAREWGSQGLAWAEHRLTTAWPSGKHPFRETMNKKARR